VTAAPLASCPRWRRHLLRPASTCDSGDGGGALILCQWLCAEDPWALDVLGWRASCSGELGVSWAQVMLSLRS
jgi:hypothetical protein